MPGPSSFRGDQAGPGQPGSSSTVCRIMRREAVLVPRPANTVAFGGRCIAAGCVALRCAISQWIWLSRAPCRRRASTASVRHRICGKGYLGGLTELFPLSHERRAISYNLLRPGRRPCGTTMNTGWAEAGPRPQRLDERTAVFQANGIAAHGRADRPPSLRRGR